MAECRSPAQVAQDWLDRCVANDSDPHVAEVAKKVSIRIGSGDEGLYVGLTLLPGTANGTALSRWEAFGLTNILIYAGDAVRRGEEAGRGDG